MPDGSADESSREVWAGRLRQPGWLLLPQRAFLGVTFCYAGLSKLADPAYLDSAAPTSFQRQTVALLHSSPIGPLLAVALHHGVLFGVLIALGELAAGLGTLAGLFSRVAAIGGLLLSLTFLLTVSWNTVPYYYGSDIVFCFLWLPLVAVGAGGVFSLDELLARRPIGLGRADPAGRRAVLTRGGAAVGLGLLALAGGGVAALLGHDRRSSLGRLAGGRPAGLTGPSPSPATGSSTGPSVGPSSEPGRPQSAAGTPVLADAPRLPVGQAAPFTDPVSGDPAFVVRETDSDYRAFDGICPHAGCTVEYLSDAREFACPCHGSTFDGHTGAVTAGPAASGLAQIPVQVRGGQVVRANT